jgi:hypothetical protein
VRLKKKSYKIAQHKHKTEGRNILTRQQGGLETAELVTLAQSDILPQASNGSQGSGERPLGKQGLF